MAIDYNAGITSLDTGASDITYSGNQGPKSPDQERQMAFDDTPGFELRSLEELLDEFRQDNNGRDPTSIDDLRRHFYIKYGPQGIAKIDKAVQQAEQQAQMQQREGIQMASAADPMLEEQYQQYVFEMQEQGMQPMSLEEFRQQAVAGMATGGRAGYKDGEMVTVPKHWQSAPDHPKTELAYITKPEKDLLVKKDLHNSLKDGPNVGPGGVMSLNGDFGIGESYGDRQVSDKSPEVGDIGGGYTEKGDPGHKEYEKARKARAKDPYYGTEHEGKGLVPTESVIETPTGVKGYKEEDYKQTLAQKHRAWRAEQARKSLKKLMLHKMKGSPFTLPGFTSAFQGPMSDEEFEKQYGMSYEDFANINPMHMEAIFGSVKDKVSQAEREDIRRLSEGLGRDDLYDPDVYNEIFYGPKGPPD